ncbi:MAG TPA: zinc ribbon domain-containing protein [Candidatus Paceibacterota bacterium]|nr:zinc ribbon domain-containing protein [Verrucomicrobiota bacterium]HRY49905.1 zinc ribbon domain-containing protein [Candidatus Paceibacterota bacterium]HSA01368.1 zinc ribbon domain-containing protein [Candidatus Paceibacterota bacterium]
MSPQSVACAFADFGYFLAMPIYEFHCQECENDSEILVRSSRWKGIPCPHCGSKKLMKKLSVFATAESQSETLHPCGKNPQTCGCSHNGTCGLG